MAVTAAILLSIYFFGPVYAMLPSNNRGNEPSNRIASPLFDGPEHGRAFVTSVVSAASDSQAIARIQPAAAYTVSSPTTFPSSRIIRSRICFASASTSMTVPIPALGPPPMTIG